MTDHPPITTTPESACDLLESRLAEVLGEDPLDLRGFIDSDEHLKSCRECLALVDSLAAICEAPACPAALVTAALDEVMARKKRNRRIGLAAGMSAAAVALLATALMLGPSSSVAPTAPTGIALHLATLDSSGANEILEGKTHAATGDTLLVSADRSLRIALSDKSSLFLPRLRDDGVTLVLENGLLAIDLDHSKHIPLSIGIGRAQIRVTGTVLFVDAEKGTTGVLQGSIGVRIEDKEELQVRAGEILHLSSGNLSPLDEGTRAVVRNLLRAAPTVATDEESPTSTLSQPPLRDTEASSPPDTGSATESTRPSATRPPRARPEGLAENAPGARDRVSQESPANLLAEARKCRAQRNWSCASERYQRAMARVPGSSEALMATVSLAELELEHLNKPEQALHHYGDYLSKAPRGVLAPEALYGRCRALGTLGRAPEEKTALQKFVKTYPDSPYARSARSRLEYLASH